MHTALLLLTVTSTLVLRSGDRIVVDGALREENGVVTFRSDGVLYRLPAEEITRHESAPASAVESMPPPEAKKLVIPKKLRVSEEKRKKLLEELQKNHSGTPAPRQDGLETLPPPPSAAEVEQQRQEEWSWRQAARRHEEAVRRAEEDLQLIESRIQELQTQIRSFLSLGYRTSQFTYQTTELAREQERIPQARLEVERAKRANDQFREDARRQGVLPGWLR